MVSARARVRHAHTRNTCQPKKVFTSGAGKALLLSSSASLWTSGASRYLRCRVQ
nr:MAG TPA: hypothetical protein [Microviridae sp.]